MCLSVLIFRRGRLGHESVTIPEIRRNHWGAACEEFIKGVCVFVCVLRSISGGEWLCSPKGHCASEKTWALVHQHIVEPSQYIGWWMLAYHRYIGVAYMLLNIH